MPRELTTESAKHYHILGGPSQHFRLALNGKSVFTESPLYCFLIGSSPILLIGSSPISRGSALRRSFPDRLAADLPPAEALNGPRGRSRVLVRDEGTRTAIRTARAELHVDDQASPREELAQARPAGGPG